jgi:RHS repeat-associated protein
VGSNYPFLTGKERDNETGLDYFINRYYSSVQGRFTSPDIFGSRRRNPQSWNRYSYVLNNPVKYTDPLGLQAQDPQDPKDIPEQVIRIIIHDKHRSLLKRIFGKIGGLFKGGNQVQTEGEEGGEEALPEESREAERKADEKDLVEREPWRDPNAIAPAPTEPLMIDPEIATEMEEAGLVPQLNGETPVQQLGDALKRVASSEGSPEAKAEMFGRSAAQIRVRSNFSWKFDSGKGTDGSHIFIGEAGYKNVHVVVISPQGTVHIGNYTGFTFTGLGATPRYDRLKPIP